MIDPLFIITGIAVDKYNDLVVRGWTGSSPYITGALIKCNTVRSLSEGTVIDINRNSNIDDNVCVTIQYDSSTWFRYCKLNSTNLSVGDKIHRYDSIGNTDSGILRFEYCNRQSSQFAVRFGQLTIYKHDPASYLMGTKIPYDYSEANESLLAIGTITETVYRKI